MAFLKIMLVCLRLDSTVDEVVAYKKEKKQKPLTDLQNQVAYQEVLNKYQQLSQQPNKEIEALKLENELRILSGKLDQMSNEELSRELIRLKIEKEIKELSNP